MQVRIIDKSSNRTTGGSSYSLFKVQLPAQIVMISETDFTKETFPKEKDSFLLLNEPLNEHYKLIRKEAYEYSFLIPNTDTVTENSKKNKQDKDKSLASLIAKKFGLDPAKQITDQKLIDEFMNEYRSQTEEDKSDTSEITNEFVFDPAQFITDQSYIDAVLEGHQSQPETSQNKKAYNKSTSIKIPQQPDQHSSSKEKSSQDKVAFITKLIELSTQKRTDERTRDRLIKLIGDEVGRSGISREEVERIVEEKLKQGLAESETNETSKKFEIDLTRHKPINLVHFIDKFRDSEGIKFLTHSYEKQSVFERAEILKTAEQEYSHFKNQLPRRLDQRFIAYAFGKGKYKGKWYFNNQPFDLNWTSNQVVEWCKNNPGMHPIEKFGNEMIKPFQLSYKIENGLLAVYINEKLAKQLGEEYGNFDIQVIDCEKATFKTDVDSLLAAFNSLFASIKQRKDKSNKIKIIFRRKGRKRFLSIIHIDSFSDKSFEEDEKDILSGDLTQVKQNLYNICDWSIIAKNPSNKYNKLNILYDINQLAPREKVSDSIEGFTHILTFYS